MRRNGAVRSSNGKEYVKRSEVPSCGNGFGIRRGIVEKKKEGLKKRTSTW